jgi:hypothetical protein
MPSEDAICASDMSDSICREGLRLSLEIMSVVNGWLKRVPLNGEIAVPRRILGAS